MDGPASLEINTRQEQAKLASPLTSAGNCPVKRSDWRMTNRSGGILGRRVVRVSTGTHDNGLFRNHIHGAVASLRGAISAFTILWRWHRAMPRPTTSPTRVATRRSMLHHKRRKAGLIELSVSPKEIETLPDKRFQPPAGLHRRIRVLRRTVE